jgi:hypothetical protein
VAAIFFRFRWNNTAFVLIAVIQFFRSKARQWLHWVLIIVLLLFPLINIWATFSDLNRKLCRDPKCTSYISGPDISNIELK